MQSEQEAYNECCYYTLAHSDPAFIHQYVVDAYTAQHATEKTKPIAVAFALVGLYLSIEKGYSGKQVQLAHMRLAQHRRTWPTFLLPNERGSMTVVDVVTVPPCSKRDEAIRQWCHSVWQAYSLCHDEVARLVEIEL